MTRDELFNTLSECLVSSHHTDQMAWALMSGKDWPLTRYDTETWHQLCEEAEPEASMTTNASNALKALRAHGRVFSFEVKSAGADPVVLVDIDIHGFDEPIASQVAKHVGIEEIGLAVATACVSAHRKACIAEAKIAKIQSPDGPCLG